MLRRLPPALIAAALFLAFAFVLYGASVRAGFVADDWGFLVLSDTAPSAAIIFAPLVDRYLRPLVVLLYYVNYKAFGLWPVPYHATAIALHALNGWLLCVLVTKLSGRRATGLFTGLLFLAFAGHSEAVVWIGGIADVVLAPFVLGALVLLAYGIERERPLRWLAPVSILLPLGLLAKETAVVAPLLASALCVYFAARSDSPAGVLRRSAAALAIPFLAVGAYMLLRARIFGNPVSAYSDLSLSAGMFFPELRAFVLRVFLPAYWRLALAWAHGYDLVLLAGGAAVFAAALIRDRDRRADMIFAAAAIAITLAPALPLTISLATTETERVIYTPSAFGALLTVLILESLVGRRALQRLLLGALVVAHGLFLQRFTRAWIEAGDAFASNTRTFVEAVRAHDPGPARLIFITNLPDNIRGAYVFRRCFYEGLHFIAPDLEQRQDAIYGISSHGLGRYSEPTILQQFGPMEIGVDVGPNRFVQSGPPARPPYQFLSWSPERFRLRFTALAEGGIVLGSSRGRVTYMCDVKETRGS